MRRHHLAVLMLAGTIAAWPGGRAGADAPTAAGWWNRLRPAIGTPADPTVPPDVTATDLYVAGTPASGTPVDTAGLQAVAALRFDFGGGQASLTLPVSGAAAIPLVACRSTSTWTPVHDGAWADAPTWDCSHAVTGRIDATSLVFDDVSPLATGSELSIVLLPAQAGRVVLTAPPPSALQTTGPGGPPASGPVDTGLQPPGSPAPLSAGAATSLPAPTPGPVTAGVPAVAGPAAAAPVTPSTPAQVALPAAHRSPLHGSRTRALAALAIVVVLAGAMVTEGQAAQLPGVLGPRVVRRPAHEPRDERGLGRFRAARTGPVPRL